jgi:hypothetical protein
MIMNAKCYGCGDPTNRRPSEGKRGVLCRKCQSIRAKLHYQKRKTEIISIAAKWNKENSDRRNIRLRERYLELKRQSVRAYGGECQNCKENELAFLTIDHINGGGRKHSTKFKKKTAHIHLWLKNNGYPEGFQILCANCNYEKEMLRRQDKVSHGHQLRAQVLREFGAYCRCCNEKSLNKLVIDHVNGGGNQHRKTVSNIYLFMKKNGIDRISYQILCQNCNLAKYTQKVCPHHSGSSSDSNASESSEAS